MYMIGYSNFNIYPTRTRVKIIGFEKKNVHFIGTKITSSKTRILVKVMFPVLQ